MNNTIPKEDLIEHDLRVLISDNDDQLADCHIEIVCEILADNLDKVKEIVNQLNNQWPKENTQYDKPSIPIHRPRNNNFHRLALSWLRQAYLPLTDLGIYPKR